MCIKEYSENDKETEQNVINSLQSFKKSESYKFLTWYLEKDIEQNVFSDTDGYTRGISDGKAKEAFNILTLINRY